VKNTVNTQFCEGNSYLLPDGRAVSLPGVYESVVATSSSGLDTVIITNLTQNPSYQFTQSAEICQGENFTLPWGGTANTSGLYQHNYQTTKGCDSVLAINLTVNPAYNIEFNPVICIGESYNLPWGGTAATQGTYQHNYAAVSGCDSVVKVYLSVSPVYDITKFDTILQGETFTLPDGNQTSIAGTYQSNLLTTSSCDSVIHTVLFVKDTSTVTAIKANFQKFNFYYSSQQNAVIIQPSTTIAIAQLEIFNAVGELIYKNEQAESNYVLPDLAKGLYLVKVLSKNMDLYSGKFIKQ
ncbi:MAG TPA: T9SS type A sorting domain-containing protein, partial [Chitinophagales bacterium]|nr:T9SS type A sorting domain-containing protein [Chitinophagales bacterium]